MSSIIKLKDIWIGIDSMVSLCFSLSEKSLYKAVFIGITIFVTSCGKIRTRSNYRNSNVIVTAPNNLQWYYPAGLNDTIIVDHRFYHLSYNEDLEQPNWVVYKLTRQMLNNASVNRSNNFREDNSILSGSAIKKDYVGSGYDRGHLVPAADMKFSDEAMSETFYLSNMSPQFPEFNRGIWNRLERKVRKWALQEDSLIIIVGPLTDSCIDWIGADSVCVPYQYFKIILDISPPEYKAIAFIIRNEGSSKSIFNFAATIDTIELLTGIDFFPKVTSLKIDSIESTQNGKLWK